MQNHGPCRCWAGTLLPFWDLGNPPNLSADEGTVIAGCTLVEGGHGLLGLTLLARCPVGRWFGDVEFRVWRLGV